MADERSASMLELMPIDAPSGHYDVAVLGGGLAGLWQQGGGEGALHARGGEAVDHDGAGVGAAVEAPAAVAGVATVAAHDDRSQRLHVAERVAAGGGDAGQPQRHHILRAGAVDGHACPAQVVGQSSRHRPGCRRRRRSDCSRPKSRPCIPQSRCTKSRHPCRRSSPGCSRCSCRWST